LKKLEEERKLREKQKKEAAVFYSKKLVNLIQSLWIFPSVIKDEELPYLKIKVKSVFNIAEGFACVKLL